MIFAIVGPSGAGKDSLITGALRARPDLRLLRRVVTRPASAGGEDFEGTSEQDFLLRRERGEFALDWQAHGLRYGIPRAQVEGPGDVVFNGSRAALPLAAQVFRDLRVILVTAPDDMLAARLARRGRETEADIRARLDRSSFSLPEGIRARTVVNDGTLEEGTARLLEALRQVGEVQ